MYLRCIKTEILRLILPLLPSSQHSITFGALCHAISLCIFLSQGLRKRSEHSDLGRTKILPFAVKVLYFQNFGPTSNCLVEVFLKWSDQSRTPSAIPVSLHGVYGRLGGVVVLPPALALVCTSRAFAC